MKRRIGWEKWIDPLNFDIDLDDDDDDDDDEVKNDYTEREKKKYGQGHKARMRHLPVMQTRNGPMPMHEYTRPGYLYNFWVGHSNWPLTKKNVADLDKILGVESLDVFSPYRFRIAVGKMFTFADVRWRIHNIIVADNSLELFNVGRNHVSEQVLEDRIRLTQELDKDLKKYQDEYRFWAAFVLPNGKKEVVFAEELSEDFIDQLNTLELTQRAVGGLILSYMDEKHGEESD